MLENMSDTIRMEVQMWSMRKVLNKTPFLRDANETFVRNIVGRMVKKVYGKGNIVGPSFHKLHIKPIIFYHIHWSVDTS